MLILWDMAKVLRMKILFALRSIYPIYVGAIGCLCVGAGMNKKSAMWMLVLSCFLLLSSIALAPSAHPLTNSPLPPLSSSHQTSRAKASVLLKASWKWWTTTSAWGPWTPPPPPSSPTTSWTRASDG